MPFCQGCGKQIGDDAKFCVSCGRPLAAGSAATPAPALAEAQPPTVDIPAIAYSIEGDSMQALRVKLTPGQEVFAEAGRMVFKTNSVSWETRASGATLAERLFGMLKRSISGESLFFTYFNCPAGEGEVGFAGAYPGKLQEIQLAEGQSFLAHRDAFICAESSVSFSVAFVKKLGAGLFGGEGFILEKFNGPGTVFIHGCGDFIFFDLQSGEIIQVDAGCIVGFDETVDYDIQLAGGIKTAFFGGEGLFLATLTGPGRCIVQTLTLGRLRRELGGGKQGGEEKNPLQAIGGLADIFSSED